MTFHLGMFEESQTPNLFPEALSTPKFFRENEICLEKTVKLVARGPHSNVRAFYFALMLLFFEEPDKTGFAQRTLSKFKQTVFSEEF